MRIDHGKLLGFWGLDWELVLSINFYQFKKKWG